MSPITLQRWRGEAAVYAALALFGAAWLYFSRTIPFIANGRPGPGFAPIVLAWACMMLGAGGIALALKQCAAEPARLGERTALITVLCLLFAAFTFEPLGFLPVTVIILSALFRAVGGVPWPKAVLIACGAALVTWAVFAKALGVNLPQGVMPL